MAKHGSERLDDESVRQHLVELWPKVHGWTDRLKQIWVPEPGSALGMDDAVTEGLYPSALVTNVIALGVDHMETALACLLNWPPRPFAVHTLLRTAMIAGAQAVWILSPAERSERLDRARRFQRESDRNHRTWVNNIIDPDPDTFVGIEEARVQLDALLAGPRTDLALTNVIETVCEYVYRQPRTSGVFTECMATWRILSGVAHGLPWEQSTRQSAQSWYDAEKDHTVTVTTPTLSDLQGAISFSYAFLDVGWRLLDQRGTIPDPTRGADALP